MNYVETLYTLEYDTILKNGTMNQVRNTGVDKKYSYFTYTLKS